MYLALSINMNLLSFFGPGQWRKARGGINTYIAKIGRELGDRVKMGSPVKTVRRRQGNLEIEDAAGEVSRFDTVVFATHADITLSMIENPGPQQRKLLGGFEYVPITSVLHSDASLIGGLHDRTEYCEFRGRDVRSGLQAESYVHGDLTRINNRLTEFHNVRTPLLVTFDPKMEPTPASVLCRKLWKLPKLRPVDVLRKRQLRRIQGVDGLWYCGTDTSFAGHEGALVSGLVIANRLGAPYPFTDNESATLQFNVVRSLMGVRRPSEGVRSAVGDLAFSLIARTKLIRSNAHRFIAEYLL
jgi:predicted NAD/FAD-binding protein